MEKHGKGSMTIIGEGTMIEGELSSPHSIRIDGTFKGRKLSTSEGLSVGGAGVIEAETVLAKNAIISGRVVVSGAITIEDRVELEDKSVLMGDLRTRDLVIIEGAVFQGNCQMDTPKAVKV
jgi:cytoskeletal protein CcmA (bactofilin family)